MHRVTLLTGGRISGKSRYALEHEAPYDRKAFIATAEQLDDEMRVRISSYQAERGPETTGSWQW